MIVNLKSEKNQSVSINTGWNWVVFLFSGVYGLPLFKKGLPELGRFFLMLGILNLVSYAWALSQIGQAEGWIHWIPSGVIQIVVFIVSVKMGSYSNLLAISKKLNNGFTFASDADEESYNKALSVMAFKYLMHWEDSSSLKLISLFSFLFGSFFLYLAGTSIHFYEASVPSVFGADYYNYQIAGQTYIIQTIVLSAITMAYYISGVLLYVESIKNKK